MQNKFALNYLSSIFKLLGVLILVSAFSQSISANRCGVALLYNEKTAQVKGSSYEVMINKAKSLLDDEFIPAVVINDQEVENGFLNCFEIVVLLSDNCLDQNQVKIMTEFVANGGKILANYDISPLMASLLGLENDVAKTEITSDLTFLYSENKLASVKRTLVKPTTKSQGEKWQENEFAAVVKTTNSIYIAEDIFNNPNHLWNGLFVDSINEMLPPSDINFAVPISDLQNLVEPLEASYKISAQHYQKLAKDNLATSEMSNLYREATHSLEALNFFIEKESSTQATYFLSEARTSMNNLFPLVHPTHKSYDELMKRGNYWFDKVEKFAKEKLPEQAFVFIGDSITEGYYLQGYLAKVKTINRGISADIASGVWDRHNLLALDSNPKAVLLMIGTNNLLYNAERNEYHSQVEEIIKFIKVEAPQAKLYLQSILPLGKEHEIAPKVAEYNEGLKKITAQEGVKYLDIYSLMVENGFMPKSLSSDGIHPNGPAYEIWSNFLLQQFSQDGLI